MRRDLGAQKDYRSARALDASEPMILEIRIDEAATRLWHLRLIEKLNKIPGVSVGIGWAALTEPLPSCIPLLFMLERMVNGLPAGGLADPAPRKIGRASCRARV